MDNNYQNDNSYQGSNYQSSNYPSNTDVENGYMQNNYSQSPYQPTYTTNSQTVYHQPQEDKEKILLGLVGAMIATIIGMLVWIIIGKVTDRIIVYVAVGMVALSFYGYKFLAGRGSVIGMLASSIFCIIAVYFGNRIIYSLNASEEAKISFKAAYKFVNHLAKIDATYKKEVMEDFIFSVAFILVAAISLFASNFKKNK